MRTGDAEERRQLTVVFCDLVGSTALAERLDPEDLQSLGQEYQAAVVSVVERFAGYVARYQGDGLLLYFGYPLLARDDDLRGSASRHGEMLVRGCH
ncbi:MAG: adenylate/guanylate cyclase domain-containing protein [Candidatus Binatia bacterium]